MCVSGACLFNTKTLQSLSSCCLNGCQLAVNKFTHLLGFEVLGFGGSQSLLLLHLWLQQTNWRVGEGVVRKLGLHVASYPGHRLHVHVATVTVVCIVVYSAHWS